MDFGGEGILGTDVLRELRGLVDFANRVLLETPPGTPGSQWRFQQVTG